MKLIIAGSRSFTNYERFILSVKAFAELLPEDNTGDIEIVTGMAKGPDLMAFKFASENKIKVHCFPANWDKYGKRAGFVRNEEMGKFGDMLLAFWDGQSKGTKHMIDYMRTLGKPVFLINV